MNSRVRVKDLNTGKDAIYVLVFPRDADFGQGKISVSSIGTAILGYRAGDVIDWPVPGGREGSGWRKSCTSPRPPAWLRSRAVAGGKGVPLAP